ncbi:MAG TPA: hypothetical protein VHH36_07455, partial [Candidatus Thermoplasmatota archaeon]|nr:hypothetical protein [Candidatus Thermoplasmatota archaeon]
MTVLRASGADGVARRLAELLSRPPREPLRIFPLPESAPARRVRAVDGSSVVVAESGAHLVGAYRCGEVELCDGVAVSRAPEEARLVLLGAADAAEAVRQALAEHGEDAGDLPALRPAAALDHLRTLAEHARLAEAVRASPAGTLVLLDGALAARPGLPLLGRALAEARTRGVDVVGACKSTSLTVGPVPALAACSLAARA